MNKILYFFLVIFCLTKLSNASALQGQQKVDSLLGALQKYNDTHTELNKTTYSNTDTLLVDILYNLSWEFMNIGNYGKAKQYSEDMLRISEKINFKEGCGNAHNTMANIYWYQGNYAEALNNYFSALKIFEQIGYKKGLAASYNNIGNIYKKQGNYPDALKNYTSSLKINKELGAQNSIATSYNNIGNIYFGQNNYSEALKNHLASLKIKEETGDRKGTASSNINIGNIYFKQGDFKNALENLFASLKIYEEFADKEGIAESYINLGEVNTKLKKYAEAKSYLVKGLGLSKELGSKENIKNSYNYLAMLDSATFNWKDAYLHHKLFMLYRDSLVNEENTQKTIQTKIQYEFDKREGEAKAEQKKKDAITLSEQKRNREQSYILILGLIMAVGFGFWDYRQKKRIGNEKKKSDDLLLNILPQEVADELKTTGRAKAKAFTMVTVMFTDFKGFTNVSEKVSAELLVDEIHHCFSAFDNIIQKHKIEKIKTIGDAYLCASGLPVSNYTHAVDMLNAAFEIRNFMLQRKKEKEAKEELPFEIRIGLHTGPVVAGIVGIKKYAYDIWGDTVNLAARMEQNSDAGKINISGTTYELVKDKFACTHRGKIEAKNKGMIDMYFVENM